MSKLKDRLAVYQQAANFKLLPKLPLIISINGRGFSKTTSLLDKPYSLEFAECMCSTLLRVVQEIDGAVFGYSFNDEIVIIARNDQSLETEPWFDNDIQKIVSAVSSIATAQFGSVANAKELNLVGQGFFTANVYTVPTLTEAINALIAKQQQAIGMAINFACFYNLLREYDKTTIKDMMAGLNYDEKIQLIEDQFQVDFYQYSSGFRKGIACYRAPVVIYHDGEQKLKSKWKLDMEVPIFTKDQDFLQNIFKNGIDIFRV